MSLTNAVQSICFAALAAVSMTAVGAAQSAILYSPTVHRSYGNSDAGATVHAEARLAVTRTSRLHTVGSGRYARIFREDRLLGFANGSAYANLRFLGNTKRAGDFRVTIAGTATIQRNPSTGAIQSSTCQKHGSVYLKIGNTVLWNQSLASTFSRWVDYRIRLTSPSLIVPIGAGVAALNGRLFGRVRGSVYATITPCSGYARLNGYAAASGNASASAIVISLLMFANFSGSFVCNDQKVEFNNLTMQPGLNASSTWGRGGSAYFRSGSMAGNVRVNAMLPPFIPISRTLASWSKGSSSRRLL